VKGVAVSGQQHGMVALGADGAVLRPAKLWCDTESAPEAAELSEKLGYTVVSMPIAAAALRHHHSALVSVALPAFP
jgi:xylulokinase